MKIPLLNVTIGRTRENGAATSAPGGVVGRDSTYPHLDLAFGGTDVNPELSGRARFETFREMKTSDPAVRSLSWLYKLPIRSATWNIRAAEKDADGPAVAEARADFARWQFGLPPYNAPRLDLTWDELNQQDLLYLDYGSMGGELVWGDPETWMDADGTPHLIRPLARIAPRMAASIAELEVDEMTGAISRIRQDVGRGEWMPGSKVTWLVNEREGSNWFGVSLLRAAYGAWKIKRQILISDAIGYDRWSSGIPVVRHPPGTEAERKAQEIGRSVRGHERAWVAFDSPKSEGVWDIDLLSGASSIADPVQRLRYLDEQIAKAGLEQFSSLGTTQTGSRAVGDVLIEPYYLAVQAVASYVAAARMRQVLRRLWDVNFGPEVPVPEIMPEKVQGENVAALARVLADLSAAGLTFADRDTQNDIRDRLDLQHLPEPAARAIDELPDDVGLVPALNRVPAEGESVLA